MLEIPYNMPMVYATLAIIFISLLPLWRSLDDKTKSNTHFFALAWVLWGLFQSVLSLNRWYMDRKGGLIHFLYPWILLGLIIWFVLYSKKGLRWSNTLNAKWLFAPAIVSISLVPLYQGLQDYKQVSTLMCSPLIYALPVLGIVGLALWSKFNSALIKSVHALILICIIAQMILGYGGIPNAHQAWDYANPNYAFQHFPYTLMPNLIYPLIFLFSAIGFSRGK